MASKYETQDEAEPPQGLLSLMKDLILKPFDIALSRTARRAYLTTFLVAATSVTLFFFAITAYTLFYLSYIPQVGFERTIHLQFDSVYLPADSRYAATHKAHPYPYGSVVLAPDVVAAQRYDIAVELTLPRTPDNTGAGNFMLEINMYAPEEKGGSSSIMDTVHAGLLPTTVQTATLANSRRPAILPYRSPLIELAQTFTGLPFHLLNWRTETDKLTVSMFEGVSFAKGWRNVPSTMKLEIQSTHRMQIYAAKAIFRARFGGLRWLMYNHRMVSAIIFVGGFWTTEMLFAGLAWAALTLFVLPPSHEVKADEIHELAEKIKTEADGGEAETPKMSETERMFPTLTGQQPLRYTSTKVKMEDEETADIVPDAVVRATEADAEDEDEDADFFLDSGLGTSMESSASKTARRRRGRLTGKEEG